MIEYLARLRAARFLAAFFAMALLLASCGSSETVTAEAGAASDDSGNGSDSEAMEDMVEETMEDMDMADDGGHSHGDVIEVPDSMAVPAISISTAADAVSGVNLFVTLADFTIAPEHASTEPVDGEGHLHLYVDGERVSRFYNTALHLTGLDAGEHEITVEVSSNNHSPYAIDGRPIRASEMITVEEVEQTHAHHDAIEVDAASAPEITLTVHDDPKAGWNLHVEVANFTVTPENASTDHIAGEGHLHLYVDGERVTRLYGPWWHLPELSEGSHEVTVEVSGNNHAVYASGGAPIEAGATIDVSAAQASDPAPHSDDDGDGTDDDHAMAHHDVLIEASVAGGEVDVESDRIDIDLGATVAIHVDVDVAEHIHLHGYDVTADVAPGHRAELMFVADVPGVFEVELEESGTLLFEIVVR